MVIIQESDLEPELLVKMVKMEIRAAKEGVQRYGFGKIKWLSGRQGKSRVKVNLGFLVWAT